MDEQYKVSNAKLNATPEGVALFADARLCCTIHWGLYSLLGMGEWVMHTHKIDMKSYESLMRQFNPTDFDADRWARSLRDAGYRLLLITSKHHDGFCMYDTALTEYKVTNTPFGRDPLKELAEACEKYGISLHFYYSLLDWYHPDYLFDWDAYVEYYHGQIRELCQNYGKIGGILLDGFWPEYAPYYEQPVHNHFLPRGDYKFGELYDMIHTLQPGAVITNNAHIPPLAGEDYQVFELDAPGEAVAGFNTSYVGRLPLASWYPMNESWGYNKNDKKYKTVGQIIRLLVKLSGMNANLYLNIGPDPMGNLGAEEERLLAELGEWMKQNGDAIYGTRALADNQYEWGCVVQKGSQYFAYQLCFPKTGYATSITVKGLPEGLTRAETMAGEALTLKYTSEGVEIGLPRRAHDPIGTIIRIW